LDRQPRGLGVAIVVNAAAGPGSDDATGELRALLPDADIVPVADDETIDDALDRADGAEVLGICGGDGSINAAAERALATARPLAVFPGGTLNHFARDLGTNDTADTVTALQHDALVDVDVGMIGGKPFLNTASFGSYADFVDAREKLEGRLGKWVAALIAAARVLRALATGRLAHTKVFTRTLARSLDFHSLAGPLRLARDGETFDGDVDVHVSKHPAALRAYAGS
jgi:diacylglycerol kinase family enzyme